MASPGGLDTPPWNAGVSIAELFRRHHPQAVKLAGLLGAADPEDVAQEAFLRILPRIESLTDAESAAAYLRATVVNLARSGFRRKAMTGRVLAARGWLLGRPMNPASAEDQALAGTDSALADRLRRLPHRQREAIVLRYWLDLSLADTAKAMDVPVGTVKSHLSRGLASLRSALVTEGVTTDG
jgi:RNA polymerase sigma factor (sigma-70 family)